MQTQNIVVFVSLIALNIFVLEVKCWLIFDDSSDNAIDTNTLELSNELGRYIIRRDSNSINDYPPPSYDTLSNRCQCSKFFALWTIFSGLLLMNQSNSCDLSHRISVECFVSLINWFFHNNFRLSCSGCGEVNYATKIFG